MIKVVIIGLLGTILCLWIIIFQVYKIHQQLIPSFLLSLLKKIDDYFLFCFVLFCFCLFFFCIVRGALDRICWKRPECSKHCGPMPRCSQCRCLSTLRSRWKPRTSPKQKKVATKLTPKSFPWGNNMAHAGEIFGARLYLFWNQIVRLFGILCKFYFFLKKYVFFACLGIK